MKLTKFEDIDAWQEARKLTEIVYGATKKGQFSKDYGLKDQVQRASVSIMANIAEGFDSGSDSEFAKFLGYAFRSATEVQSHLYVAMDQGYITQEQFDEIYGQAVIRGFIRYLKSDLRSPTSNV